MGVNGLIYGQDNSGKRVKLEEYKRIDNPGREEVSGIIKSKNQEGIYWVHGDSGTDPRIYAINREGEMAAGKEYEGLEIAGFKNIDWEDIAIDDSGNLIVADVGNNCECRENLSLLIFEEPVYSASITQKVQKIKIKYPGGKRFWGMLSSKSYNAEAVFFDRGSIYVITKTEKGEASTLFRLSDFRSEKVNILESVSEFDFKDTVTGADLSPEKSTLAVLTYSRIWLFSDYDGSDYFSGKIRTLSYKAGQTEAITFDGEDQLIITNESGDLFEIKISDFR